MKTILRVPYLLILMLLALLVLTGCSPYIPSISTGGLVVGQSYHLSSGETLNNDLTIIGGDARLDQGSTVNGDIAVIGGSVLIDGKVNGSVSIIGGSTNLDDHAQISGDVNALGGAVHKSQKAVIEGNQTNRIQPVVPPTVLRTPPVNVSFDPIGAPLMAIFQGLAMAALAVLIALFAPTYLDRAGQTAVRQPFASGGVGCLTIIILVIMAITIILLPVSLVGFMIVMIAALFGWAALGLHVGRQLGLWLKQPWSDPVNAGIGTLAISLLTSLLNVVICVGGPIYVVAGLVVLGATVLTRFGTQPYLGEYRYAPRPVVPYMPPTPVTPVSTATVDEGPYRPAGSAQMYDAPQNPSDEPENNPPA